MNGEHGKQWGGHEPQRIRCGVSTTYLELRSRLFVDADILSFEGFVPTLFVGIDVIEINSNLGTTQSNIPVFGVDLELD